MKAAKAKEVLLSAANRVGELADIAQILKENDISLQAISAWVFEDRAFFRLISSNSEKLKEVLRDKGTLDEREVVIADLPDEAGQLFSLASKLTDAEVDVKYVYGSSSPSEKSAIIVFASDNNDKALEVITK